MRTRKISNTRFSYKLDKLFWFFVQIFPLLCFAVFCIAGARGENVSLPTFNSFLLKIGINYQQGNVFYTVLAQLFSSGGVFPLFADSGGIVLYLTYVLTMEVLHVCFDVIVFIPRLAHKWISKAVQDD